MHAWLFYNTVSIKWANLQYTTLYATHNFPFVFPNRKFEIRWRWRNAMQRCFAETIPWASLRACQVHASVKEETPPSINLLVVDSNALLTRLQFYLGSWQLEAEGLYSRDSGIMNSAGPTSILFWTLFPLIWDHGVRNPHFHRIPRFPGRRGRFHSVMFRNIAISC